MPSRLPTEDDFPSSLTLSITPPPNSEPPTNILILLHGLGDTNTSFTNLGKNMALPETACLSIQAPAPLPFELGGFHWGDDIIFDQESGDMEFDTGFSKTVQLLAGGVIRGVLVEKCGYRGREIFVFGFGQGGMAGLAVAAAMPDVELGGVISIGGPAPSSSSIPPTGGKIKTLILLLGGSARDGALTSTTVAKTKDLFGFVTYTRWTKLNDTMPGSREEMLPIMQFFARRLRSRRGVPEGSVETPHQNLYHAFPASSDFRDSLDEKNFTLSTQGGLPVRQESLTRNLGTQLREREQEVGLLVDGELGVLIKGLRERATFQALRDLLPWGLERLGTEEESLAQRLYKFPCGGQEGVRMVNLSTQEHEAASRGRGMSPLPLLPEKVDYEYGYLVHLGGEVYAGLDRARGGGGGGERDWWWGLEGETGARTEILAPSLEGGDGFGAVSFPPRMEWQVGEEGWESEGSRVSTGTGATFVDGEGWKSRTASRASSPELLKPEYRPLWRRVAQEVGVGVKRLGVVGFTERLDRRGGILTPPWRSGVRDDWQVVGGDVGYPTEEPNTDTATSPESLEEEEEEEEEGDYCDCANRGRGRERDILYGDAGMGGRKEYTIRPRSGGCAWWEMYDWHGEGDGCWVERRRGEERRWGWGCEV